jgi:hypothetical protein
MIPENFASCPLITATVRHLSVSELPEGDRFSALGTESRHLIDTVKTIVYRAETAMAQAL